MSKIAFILLLFSTLYAELVFEKENHILIENKRIYFEDYPDAFNPSIVNYGDGYLLTFRYVPFERNQNLSYIGICLLNDAFEPISKPEILLTRHKNSITQSQSEDARLFQYRNKLFVIYNDNIEVNNPTTSDRRDIFIAEVLFIDGHFTLSAPLKLWCNEKQNQLWQKNWVAFEWNHILYLSYSINPHEILYANLITGECFSNFSSSFMLDWEYGSLRGSSQATLVDGEYFALIHSGKKMPSPTDAEEMVWYYFMGAYTFSSKPPFEIRRISQKPIVAEGFYEPGDLWKNVIFPGGYVVQDPYIHIVYGKNDSEIWIATLEKKALLESLVVP